MWYEQSTQRVFSTHSDVRVGRQDVSLPEELTDEVLLSIGVLPVVEGPQPTPTPYVDRVVEDGFVVVGDTAVRQWKLQPLSADEVAEAKQTMVAACDHALTIHLDTVAQARRYDNRITCALRAGYPGPFQAEGQAFAAWMDACNAQAYALLAEVQAGAREIPESPQALIDALPPMEWPAT